MISDVLRHSKMYWLGINAKRMALGLGDGKQNRPRMVSVRDVGSAVCDVLGGLVGYVYGGVGAIVGAPVGSLMFQMGLDGLNGAIETLDDGDYYWPADWLDDAC